MFRVSLRNVTGMGRRGKCVICLRKVCVSCSAFYSKRFCAECGPTLLETGALPPEMAQTVKSLSEGVGGAARG